MCGGPAWKREVVQDHKFDFVDPREFTDNGFGMRMKYLWLYLLILKSFLVYVSDIFTAVTMLTTKGWSNDIFNSCTPGQNCIPVDFDIGKWVFFGCIVFGFLLLAYESRKTRRIVLSRDISAAFTNVMANNYYSLRSYDHFCFFDHISNSTKKKDDFAFFVFFTFKGWKRLLLADGPRQAINGITLYSFFLSKKDQPGDWYDVQKYFRGRDLVPNALTCTIVFTTLVFVCSLLLLIAAAICYIPLLCYVQGNLKEYCCHKVDKRIAEIIKRRNKQRQQKAAAIARKEAAGDFSHLKGRKGAQALPQPTLPKVMLDDDEFSETASQRTRGPAPSTFTSGGDSYYYGNEQKLDYGSEYPPMPAYHQQPYHQQQQIYQPQPLAPYEVPDHYYDSDYAGADQVPFAQAAPPPAVQSARGDVAHAREPLPPRDDNLRHSVAGLAYDDDFPPHGGDRHQDQHGYDAHPQAYDSHPQGYDAHQQGYDSHQQGYDAHHQGYYPNDGATAL